MKHKIKLLITFVCVVTASSLISAAQNPPQSLPQNLPKTAEKLPLDDLERFTTVIEYIQNYYVKPVDDPELFENAIRGMLAGLDPHSAYLDKEEFAELKASTSGKFGGLGIEVTMEDGYIKVITPIDGTPAAEAGIAAGDMIIRIDETPIKDLSLRDAVEKMRGKPGTDISLTIVRKGEPKPLLFKLKREVINVKSVTSKMLEDGYGYIRISQFQNDTGSELTKAVKDLLAQNKGKLKGLVLDLRNNPGGVLDSSVQVASAFLDKDKLSYDKMVVFTKGRLPSSQIKERATGKDLLTGTPLIVLINGGSASAAEIVAGALQDQKRAIILGTTSFGKASVQTVLPLKDQRGLKLTTALYYTPSGKSIQARGIVPDVVVENAAIPTPEATKIDDISIHEADLQGHLENKTAPLVDVKSVTPETPQAMPKSTVATGKDAKKDVPLTKESDNQLFEALNRLKAQQAANTK